MNIDINIYLKLLFIGILLATLIVAVFVAPGPKKPKKHE